VNLKSLLDRPPPHSLESEMALLGSMILDAKVIPDVAATLPANAFYREAHAAIYEAITGVHRETGTVDLVQLVATLEGSGKLADVGGGDYLLRLAQTTPSSASAPYYAKVVADRYARRRLFESASAILASAHDEPDTQAALASAASAIASVVADGSRSELAEYGDAAAEVLALIEQGMPSVYATGLGSFDSTFAGIPQDGLTYIMGVPSSGKSSLAMQFAYGIAYAGVPTVVFSFEVGKVGAARNLLASDSMVPLNRMSQRGEKFYDKKAEQRVRDAAERAAKMPLRFVEQMMTVEEIDAQMGVLVAKGYRCCVVDYIQNVPASNKQENEAAHISHVCSTLQRMHVKHKICVIAVTQMTLSSLRDDRTPRMSDAIGSSKIVQTSSMTIAVHRPSVYKGREADESDQAWRERAAECYLHVLKSKVSSPGVLPVRFEGQWTRFFNHGETIYNKPLIAPPPINDPMVTHSFRTKEVPVLSLVRPPVTPTPQPVDDEEVPF